MDEIFHNIWWIFGGIFYVATPPKDWRGPGYRGQLRAPIKIFDLSSQQIISLKQGPIQTQHEMEYPGPQFKIQTFFTGIQIPIIKIRWSRDHDIYSVNFISINEMTCCRIWHQLWLNQTKEFPRQWMGDTCIWHRGKNQEGLICMTWQPPDVCWTREACPILVRWYLNFITWTKCFP